jgi:hypothetical protein
MKHMGSQQLTFCIAMVDTILFENLKDLGTERFLCFFVFGVASPPLVVAVQIDPVEKDCHTAITSVNSVSLPWDGLFLVVWLDW